MSPTDPAAFPALGGFCIIFLPEFSIAKRQVEVTGVSTDM